MPEQKTKQSPLVVLSRLHHYLDLVGFALFAPATLQLLLALQYGGTQLPWNSSRVIGLFCGSVGTFVAWFFWNQHKGDDALLPPSMIKQKVVWASGLYQSFMISAVYGATFFLPIYFQAIENATAMLSGVYLLPTILPQLVAAVFSGVLCKCALKNHYSPCIHIANLLPSAKDRVCNTLGHCWYHPSGRRKRAVLAPATRKPDWILGRISDLGRDWLRA